jgi:two-component system sensor histidine kinase RegB
MVPTVSFTEPLHKLLWVRLAMIAAEAAAVLVARFYLEIVLPWLWMLALLAVFALGSIAWARMQRGVKISERLFFLHLSCDVAVLAALLYASGGSANPFVSLFLVPLVVVATVLPARYAWAMAALTAACYALLFFTKQPAWSAHHGAAFDLHLMGMWVNFLVCAILICWLVVRMAAAIRSRDEALAKQREDALRNERIVALGTLAAGAAHELGTPLSTMAVLLADLAEDCADQPALSADIATLRNQVAECKHTITRMVAAAGEARAEGGGAQPVDEFVRETLDRWRLLRPAATVHERLSGASPAPEIVTEHTLQQAIISLLNNAADASPREVELDCQWDRMHLRMEIRDRGGQLAPEVISQAGRRFFSTKPVGESNGIGLVLAHATLQRLGGRIELSARDGGGARTLLELPLAGLLSTRSVTA